MGAGHGVKKSGVEGVGMVRNRGMRGQQGPRNHGICSVEEFGEGVVHLKL